MRAGLLTLIAVAILGAPPARAYLAATSGVEIVVTSLGGDLWEMTLESDRAVTDLPFDLDQGSASMAYTTGAPCDGIVAICNSFDESLTTLPALIFGLSIIQPTDPSIFTGVGNPVLLGQLTTTGPLTSGVNPPEWGTALAELTLCGHLGCGGLGGGRGIAAADLRGTRLQHPGRPGLRRGLHLRCRRQLPDGRERRSGRRR